MRIKTFLSILALGLIVNAFSQNPTMELVFTAEYNGQFVPLDSILIKNLTQGMDTILYAPDTILSLEYSLGLNYSVMPENTFILSQNYPNPFKGKTKFNVYLPEKDNIKITVCDIIGSKVITYEDNLNQGNHSFTFYSGNKQIYLLTVTGKQMSKTIKMLNANIKTVYDRSHKIVYNGYEYKVIDIKSEKAINGFEFNLGDKLQYTGYAISISDVLSNAIIIDIPQKNTDYEFNILTGLRCPGMPTVEDIEGNLYNTVQIGDQCWMKENLKTTTYQNGTPIPNVTSNSAWSILSTGAYVWYDNDISWKDKYGALYNFYTTIDSNGLCPKRWHVPSIDEWTVFPGFDGGFMSQQGDEFKSCRQVNSPLGGTCNTPEHPRWENYNSSIYGTDDYGFSGLPGGIRSSYYGWTFSGIGNDGFWWSTTNHTSIFAYPIEMGYNSSFMDIFTRNIHDGFSVRCIKDEVTPVFLSVETGSIVYITPISAIVEGEITDLGISGVIQHGLCWSTEQPPLISDNKTELGAISTIGPFTSNIIELETQTTYYVRAYAINDQGIDYGETLSFVPSEYGTGIPCPDSPTLTDIDGNEYNTVLIGDQCWMKENLKTTTYRNGTPIPNVTSNSAWSNLSTGAYDWYGHDIYWKDKYGGLYNWFTTIDTNGLCPEEWHVPTNEEWLILINFIGGTTQGNKLKSCRQVNSPYGGGCNTSEHPRWREYNQYNGTNDYGFSGLPGGIRNVYNWIFNNMGDNGYWWSSTEGPYIYAYQFTWSYGGGMQWFTKLRRSGLSVRCIME